MIRSPIECGIHHDLKDSCQWILVNKLNQKYLSTGMTFRIILAAIFMEIPATSRPYHATLNCFTADVVAISLDFLLGCS